MKSKILHIVGAMNTGGTETMLMNVYRNIDRDNIQFDFISFDNNKAYYDDEIESLGGRVIRIPNPKSIKEIKKTIKENGPYKAVHAHTQFNCGFSMIAAKQCGVGIRISHAHTNLNNNRNIIKDIYSKLMRYIINNYSTKILACSNNSGKCLFGEKAIKDDKYSLLQNLIDYNTVINPDYEQVEQFKKNYNLNNSLVLGHIGTFKESKNQKFLIEIIKNIKDKDIKLLLVGDGSMRDELQELVNKYNLNDKVVFAGIRKDINNMLNCMDVFVFPSIFEGLGMVLLEAQASGIPCVVSDVIQPEVDLGLGLINKLSLNDNIQSWINKILEVQSKKILDKDLIMKSFDDKGYSLDKCISRLKQIYEV